MRHRHPPRGPKRPLSPTELWVVLIGASIVMAWLAAELRVLVSP